MGKIEKGSRGTVQKENLKPTERTHIKKLTFGIPAYPSTLPKLQRNPWSN